MFTLNNFILPVKQGFTGYREYGREARHSVYDIKIKILDLNTLFKDQRRTH